MCTIIIVNAYKGENRIYKVLLSNKALIYLGKISYGLYLYHFPIFYLKELGLVKPPQTLAQSILIDVISVIAALILSVISYEYIEKYFLLLKKKIIEN
jgi:peptidoglycan/LPS O-acetylase OafA/YrhL